MTTAREQARTAAVADMESRQNVEYHRLVGADAASNVWDPLLRDLLDTIESKIVYGPKIVYGQGGQADIFYKTHPWIPGDQFEDGEIRRVLDKAKEALG